MGSVNLLLGECEKIFAGEGLGGSVVGLGKGFGGWF